MATGVITWSQTAASNATADANINWAEGMAPSQVNDSARAMMASVAKWRDDNNGNLSTTGSSAAYVVTSNQGFASLAAMSGQTIKVYFTLSNDTNATLNVDGLGAKRLSYNDSASTTFPAGFIRSNNVYELTYDNSSSTWNVVGPAIQNFLPPGIILPYGATSAPDGWLTCDGSAVSRTGINARLFAIIGTTYGIGDGSSTFNLPDMRARIPVGFDSSNATGRMGGAHTGNINGGAGTMGNTGGEENHTLTTSELPSFTPSGTIGGSQTFSNVLTSSGGQNVGSAAAPAVNVPGSITVNGSNFTFTGNAIGSGSSHNVVQPSLIVNYIIKL